VGLPSESSAVRSLHPPPLTVKPDPSTAMVAGGMNCLNSRSLTASFFAIHFFLLANRCAFFANPAKEVRGCFFFRLLYAFAYRLLYALALRLTFFTREGVIDAVTTLEEECEPRASPQFGQKLARLTTSIVASRALDRNRHPVLRGEFDYTALDSADQINLVPADIGSSALGREV